MNYKEEVVITRTGPFKAMDFQFKGAKFPSVGDTDGKVPTSFYCYTST